MVRNSEKGISGLHEWGVVDSVSDFLTDELMVVE